MKKIEDVRRENLRRLRDELGSVQALADLVGKSQSQISQWLNGSIHSASGKPRAIGSASCREVEKATGKPEGWMDVEHSEISVAETTEVVVLRKIISETSAEVRLLSVYRLADASQRELIDGAVRLVIDGLNLPALVSARK